MSRDFSLPSEKSCCLPFPKDSGDHLPTGAAIQDFLKVVAKRDYPLQLSILPVKVQGKDAGGEIVDAIALAEKIADVRGDRPLPWWWSIEDLWAYNEERVAEAIFHCLPGGCRHRP